MTNPAASNNRKRSRSGLAALAALGLPLGALLAPGTATAATGTDLTTVLLAIGLMTIGAGSIIAVATRPRRDDVPT